MTKASNRAAVHPGRPVTRDRAGTPQGQPAAPTGDRPLRAAYFTCLGGLVVVATVYGLVAKDAYRLVSDLTRQTWRAQDAVTLLLVPVLLWSSRRARAGSLSGHLLTTGIALWLAYCYAHLSIGAPLNPLFLVYVAILALAGFAALDGLVRIDVAAISPAFGRTPRPAAAWLLTVGGIGTGALWLSEIVGAWPNGMPSNIHLSQLPNPTWVLDLTPGSVPMSHRQTANAPAAFGTGRSPSSRVNLEFLMARTRLDVATVLGSRDSSREVGPWFSVLFLVGAVGPGAEPDSRRGPVTAGLGCATGRGSRSAVAQAGKEYLQLGLAPPLDLALPVPRGDQLLRRGPRLGQLLVLVAGWAATAAPSSPARSRAAAQRGWGPRAGEGCSCTCSRKPSSGWGCAAAGPSR